MRAVSDAGPLIHLSWLGRLDLLGALFEEVPIPEAVRDEVLHPAADAASVSAIRDALAAGALRVRAIAPSPAVDFLLTALHRGEAEAIALMHEAQADLLLLDDRRAREEAARRGLRLTGTIGLLQEASQLGLVEAVYPLVAELQQRGFSVSSALLERLAHEDALEG